MTVLSAWQNFWRTTLTIHVTASRLYFADTTTRKLAVTRAQNVFHMITAAGDSWKAPTADSETALNGNLVHIVMALLLRLEILSTHRCLRSTMA